MTASLLEALSESRTPIGFARKLLLGFLKTEAATHLSPKLTSLKAENQPP
jgi:hypothetical protein